MNWRVPAMKHGVNKPAVFEIRTKSRPAATWKQTAILPRPLQKRVDHDDSSKVLRIINDLGNRLLWLGLREPYLSGALLSGTGSFLAFSDLGEVSEFFPLM